MGFARSNYFEVKDPRAFEEFCGKWDLELIRGGEDGGELPLYGFICRDDSGIPNSYSDAESGDWIEGDFMAELSGHLSDGWVALVREVGYEKMRYLVGYTLAINSKGERQSVDLNSIYESAKGLGSHVTECEW